MDLDNFQVRLQYGVASLCNELLPEFSSNQFETLHRYYKHLEDMHVTFSRQENHFGQNYGILDLRSETMYCFCGVVVGVGGGLNFCQVHAFRSFS